MGHVLIILGIAITAMTFRAAAEKKQIRPLHIETIRAAMEPRGTMMCGVVSQAFHPC